MYNDSEQQKVSQNIKSYPHVSKKLSDGQFFGSLQIDLCLRICYNFRERIRFRAERKSAAYTKDKTTLNLILSGFPVVRLSEDYASETNIGKATFSVLKREHKLNQIQKRGLQKVIEKCRLPASTTVRPQFAVIRKIRFRTALSFVEISLFLSAQNLILSLKIISYNHTLFHKK